MAFIVSVPFVTLYPLYDRRQGCPMNSERPFDPKYAAIGVGAILLSILVLVILPNILKKQLAKIGKN